MDVTRPKLKAETGILACLFGGYNSLTFYTFACVKNEKRYLFYSFLFIFLYLKYDDCARVTGWLSEQQNRRSCDMVSLATASETLWALSWKRRIKTITSSIRFKHSKVQQKISQ